MSLYAKVLMSLVALAVWGSAPGAEPGTPDAGLRLLGQRIYRDGILPSGKPLAGMAQADVTRIGKEAACTTCHRRSGLGSAEGSIVIRPIAGPDLYQTRVVAAASPRISHQLGKPVRPAYDDTTLARAIREGVDVTGRAMASSMPRYALSDTEMQALTAYLKSLSADASPGVSAEEVHLATVIQPGVPAAKRSAMLGVIEAFLRDKNAGVRSEEARRKVGAMRMYRAYRKWNLHVWELTGPPDTWGAQLERRYAEQPVFALVGGLGAAGWQPIHDFSERHEVPCILPLTDLPATDEDNFYTVYFSRGIALEAESLARYLDAQTGQGDIVQVFRPDGPGGVAASAFRAALGKAARRLVDHPLFGRPGVGFPEITALSRASAIVLWLTAEDLTEAGRYDGDHDAAPVYLSASLLDGDLTLPRTARIFMTYPWEVPALREPRVMRSQQWLRLHGLDVQDEGVHAVAVNTLFALTVAGDALAHLQDSFLRDYFVERVEHNISTTLMPSFYPRVSLGPDQRYASKGIYIVQRAVAPGSSLSAVTDWVVP